MVVNPLTNITGIMVPVEGDYVLEFTLSGQFQPMAAASNPLLFGIALGGTVTASSTPGTTATVAGTIPVVGGQFYTETTSNVAGLALLPTELTGQVLSTYCLLIS